MATRILVSPVGSTDPVTKNRDSALTHIVRYYEFDKIYLLLSREMRKHEDNEEESPGAHRYTRAIEEVCKWKGRACPEIEKLDIEEVAGDIAKFDVLIPKFREILDKIKEEYPDAEITLNLTSGTMQMISSLLVIHTFGLYNTRAIQVTNPDKKNARDANEEYRFEEIWKENLDNKEGRECRCREVQTQNFEKNIMENNLKILIDNLDFVGALLIAKNIYGEDSEIVKYIQGAVDRINMRSSEVGTVKWKDDTKYNPNDRIFEYLSVLELYLYREQWADFLRGITPALFELCLKLTRAHPETRDFIKKDGEKWVILQKEFEKIGGFGEETSKLKFYDGKCELYSSILIKILNNYENNKNTVKMLKEVRKLEDTGRNDIAHNIRSIDKEKIENKAEIKFDKALDNLFNLNGTIKGRRDLYKKIGQNICDMIKG